MFNLLERTLVNRVYKLTRTLLYPARAETFESTSSMVEVGGRERLWSGYEPKPVSADQIHPTHGTQSSRAHETASSIVCGSWVHMTAGISTRNRATMEKSYIFVEVESLCGATGYPLRTPRLEDTVLDAHTCEPITVITRRCLGVLRFFRWSQPGHNQKLAHLLSEILVERSHLMFCTNCHKIDITTGTVVGWKYIHTRKNNRI